MKSRTFLKKSCFLGQKNLFTISYYFVYNSFICRSNMLIILTIRKVAEAVSRRDSNSKILFSTSLLSKYPFARNPLPKAAGFFCVVECK